MKNNSGIKLQSPPTQVHNLTLKFPTGNAGDRFLKVDSVTGSRTTGVGQLSLLKYLVERHGKQ